MTKLRLIVFVVGAMLIIGGALGLWIHSNWSDAINISFIAFGATINLIQGVIWLPSQRAKRQASAGPALKSNGTFKQKFNRANAAIGHNFTPSPWLGITIILIAVGLLGLYTLRTFFPDAHLIPFSQTSWTLSVSSATSASHEYLTVSWSPDDKYIAYAGNDNKVHVWDVLNKHIVCIYAGHHDSVLGLAWSHDGTRIASASADGTVQVWTAMNGHRILKYPDHTAAVNAVSWSPNDARIASASTDETVRVWDVLDGVTVYMYRGHHSAVEDVQWSHNGNRIASVAGDNKNQVQLWDATTGGHVVTYSDAHIDDYALAWSPDDTRVASTDDNVVRVWDALTGGKIVSVVCSGYGATVNTVSWSPDGAYVASGSNDNTARVCNTGTGNSVTTYKGHADSVTSLAWASHSSAIVTASNDGTVQVWNAFTGKLLFTPQPRLVNPSTSPTLTPTSSPQH